MEQNIMNAIQILLGLGVTSLCPFAIKLLMAVRKKLVQEFGAKEEAEIEIYAGQVVNVIAAKYMTLSNEQKFAKAAFLLEAHYGLSFISESELEILIEDAYKKFKNLEGNLVTPVIAPVVPTPEVTPVVVEPVVDPVAPEVTPVVEPIIEPVVAPVVIEPVVAPVVTPVAPIIPEVVVTPVITPEVPVVAPVVVPVALSDEITNAISTIVAEQIAKALVVPTIPTV